MAVDFGRTLGVAIDSLCGFDSRNPPFVVEGSEVKNWFCGSCYVGALRSSMDEAGWNSSVSNSVAGLVPYGGLVRGGQKSKGICMEIKRGPCTFYINLLRLPFIMRSNLNLNSPTPVQDEPAAFNTNSNASIRHPCITITDNDHIEKSNLNRQFLFRPEHVGMAKSQVAAESILQFNPALKVVPLTYKFCVDTTETIFTDEYIQIAASGVEKSSPPVVLAALDNIEARQYLDQRCVINRLAMFDSGTQGTKGHTQAILPGITESYNDQSDPGSSGAGEIPYCTLKSFPAKPVDCVEWAREKFFTLFTLKPQNLSTLLCNFHNSSKCLLEAFQSVLTKGLNEFQNCKINASNLSYLVNRPRTIEDCIHLALGKFEKYFRDKALNLLHRFPPDFTTSRGELFWQLPRRKPTPLTFDITNSLHLEFIWSFSRLLCLQSGMPLPSRTLGDFERNLLTNAVKSFTSKPYIPLDKEVVVDPTVQRPVKKAATEECPALDNNLRDALQKAIETLREYKKVTRLESQSGNPITDNLLNDFPALELCSKTKSQRISNYIDYCRRHTGATRVLIFCSSRALNLGSKP
ncbi:hypothetical protein ACTXT7_005367 [Hymenolepis weldensis]